MHGKTVKKYNTFLKTKKKKSLGYDEITIKILKACASLISHLLSYIYNHSPYTDTYLTVWNFSSKATSQEGRQT